MTDEGFTFHVQERHVSWLRAMKERYDIFDEHKALRILFEYAMQEGDADHIFGEVRCANC